ncbi:hypothetical protein [Sphingobacterium thalpophilum]|uniref:hypothetical protein n=1 Tax=Sphingobacterium thalpophilum TaxID=259 RepID=UPI0031D1ACC3
MQRKKLHIRSALLFMGSGLCAYCARAQIIVTLPQTNIQTRADYSTTINAGQYNSVLTVLPTFRVRAGAPSFNSTVNTNFAASLVHIKLASIGALPLLSLSGNTEVALSTSNQNLYTALASIASGQVMANTRIATASQTWTAGDYSNSLFFSTQGLLAGSISPTSFTLTISVPAFISPPSTIGSTTVLVNDLNFYRSANAVSGSKVIPVSTTVPYVPSLRTGSAQFSFNTSFPYINLPVVPVSAVSTTLNGVATANTVSLSTSDQPLTSASGIAVPTNNSHTVTHSYSISAAQLKNNFLQAGTYSTPLTYTWSKPSSADPPNPVQAQASGSLNIVVSDLGEIIANQQNINLNFVTANDYKNGISVNSPAHLRVSKTTPYNLYVRATSNSFVSGANSIPLNVLRIGPMAGQTGISTITLSTTAQQLIQNANPVIDRNLDMQFSIPASETNKLLNKPSGSYVATIVYSFVAP